MWEEWIPEGFELPHVPTFNGMTYPGPHIRAINDQTAIVGATNTLKRHDISIGTLKDEALNGT